MSDYAITFARSARKELEALDEKVVNRIFPKIESLSKDPRPSGCIKLAGNKNLWRIRAGDYRVVYAIYDNKNLVDIVAVRHRKDVYDSVRLH
jgi:mRNA interferase RelE/StbE